jgi:hypothetical protein
VWQGCLWFTLRRYELLQRETFAFFSVGNALE